MNLQLKDEIALRKQKNLAELAELDDVTRLEMEGYRGGTYLRLELHGMPYEMVHYFDPTIPLLVGGLARGEEAVGFMQVSQSYIFSHTILVLYHSSFLDFPSQIHEVDRASAIINYRVLSYALYCRRE